MGAGGSSLSRDYLSFMAFLSLEPHHQDEKYWTDLISHAGPRNDFSIPSPRLLNEIATKFPLNMKRLMEVCVEFLQVIDGAKAKEPLPQIVRDQIAQVVWVFTIGTLVTAMISEHNHIYYYIIGLQNDIDIYSNSQEQEKNTQSKEKTNMGELSMGNAIDNIDANPDCLMNRFLCHIYNLLFSENLTCSSNCQTWGETPETDSLLQLLRYDLIHSLLSLLNLYQYTSFKVPAISMKVRREFPSELFIQSVCRISAQYTRSQNGGSCDNVDVLLKDCFAFLTESVIEFPEVLSAFKKVPAEIIIIAFTGSLTNPFSYPLIFEPHCKLNSEALSFLSICVQESPQFIEALAKNAMSNDFIHSLLSLIQFTLEQVGPCFVHRIGCFILDKILSNKECAENLQKPCIEQFTCSFRPHRGSYSDVVSEFLCNFTSHDMIDAVSTILCRIASSSPDLSLYACYLIFAFFERTIENPEIAKINAVTLMHLIQSKTSFNAKVFAVQKANLSKKLATAFDIPSEVILQYLAAAKPLLAKDRKLSTDEAIAVLKKLPNTQQNELPQVRDFDPGTEQWVKWGYLLFTKCFTKEEEKFLRINFR